VTNTLAVVGEPSTAVLKSLLFRHSWPSFTHKPHRAGHDA